MKQYQIRISVQAPRPGMHDITGEIEAVVRKSGVFTGACHVFIQHTSASLLIQENADPSARSDLEAWMNRMAPARDPAYTHTAEGPDDMPSHLKCAVTSTSELIPVVDGCLGLGTWQGLYLFEHRNRPSTRSLTVHVWGE